MKKTRRILSLVLSIAMILSMFTFALPTTTQAATGISKAYDGSKVFSLNMADDYEVERTFGHGGIGGKAADDVVGYVEVPAGVSLAAGGGCFTDTPWYYAVAAAKTNNRVLMAMDVLFADENAKLSFEFQGIETHDSTKSISFGAPVFIGAANGVTVAASNVTVADADAPDSLSLNEWHNIAVEVVNDGTNALNVYVDGVKYEYGLRSTTVGTYRFRANVMSGSFYIDNYYCYEDVQAQDMYAEESYLMTDITVEDTEKLSYDADKKQFTILDESLTVAELKATIATDCTVAVYEDASYKKVLEDADLVRVKSAVVVSNGKGYKYYDFYRENTTDFNYIANGDGLSCFVTGYKADKIPASGSVLEIPAEIAGYTVTGVAENAFRVGSVKENEQGLYLPNGIRFSEIKMPDTIKTIGAHGFYDTYAQLNSWPDDLVSIGRNAFVHGGTMSGDFPAGLKKIGSAAFQFSNIKTPVFPEGLETIEDSAFLWCGNMTSFRIPDGIVNFGKNVLQISLGLQSVRFPRSEKFTAIPATTLTTSYPKRNDRMFKDMAIYIPETITTIPRELLTAFRDGANVTIYGVTGSPAYEYYLAMKAELEAGTLVNTAKYPDVDNGNAADLDGDGLGELASITFKEYDYILDTDFSSEGVNTGGTNVNLYSTTDGTVATAGVAGNGGKLAEDVIINVNSIGGDSGHNYFGAGSAEGTKAQGVFYHEISVRAPEVGCISVQYGAFTAEPLQMSVFDNTNPDIWSVTPTTIKVAGVKVMDIVPGRWYAIATEIKNGGSTEAAVYVNGVKYDVKLKKPSYGVRHFRVYHYKNDEAYDAFYDNISAYTSVTKAYISIADKEATLTAKSDEIGIYPDGIVYADKEKVYTAGELKAMLETNADAKANIRIYSDDTYTVELSDNENVTNESMVVVAATNRYDIERVYSYYPINPPINTTIFDFQVISETEKTARITGFNERNITETDDLSAIAIPEEILGYTITEIGDNAFYQNRVIQTVSLPDTVTVIGNKAFGDIGVDGKSQGKITSVKLSKNLKEIGASAFAANPIKEIEFPEGLEKIGASAFYWTNIRSVSLPNSVKSVGSMAFRLTSVKYLKLSSGMTDYSQGQFASSSTVVNDLIIPASVTNIGPNVFRDLGKDENGNATIDNTSAMQTTVVHGVKGTYAETYAAKYGFTFKPVNSNTIVTQPTIYGDGNKVLAGTDYDIRYGYKDLTFKASLINMGDSDVEALVMLVLYDENGAIITKDIEDDITVKAGETVVIDETSDVKIDIDGLKHGYTAKAFIWRKSNNEPICPATEFTFDESKKELHVLAIANSFCNDSFGYINDIARADDVVLKVQNMYIGGATLSRHYKNMLLNDLAYTPVINMAYGAEKSESVDGALASDKWDVVALQCASHGFSKDLPFVDYKTWKDDASGSNTGTPGITTGEMYEFITNYVKEREPDAKRVIHMSWSPCEDQSRKMYDARFKDVADARDAMFELQKDAYLYASSIFADECGMMVPSSYAVQYALNVLGFQEHSGPVNGEFYDKPVAGEYSIYRDETCHLTLPYGRVLAGLTWYEYLTGNDARENKYENPSIPAEIMAGLKEAAHWANTQVVPLTGSAQ